LSSQASLNNKESMKSEDFEESNFLKNIRVQSYFEYDKVQKTGEIEDLKKRQKRVTIWYKRDTNLPDKKTCSRH